MTKSKRKPPRRRPAANDPISRVPALKSTLEKEGIPFDATDPTCWRVTRRAGETSPVWLLWPTGFWRPEQGGRQGYDVRSLIAAVKASRETLPPSG